MRIILSDVAEKELEEFFREDIRRSLTRELSHDSGWYAPKGEGDKMRWTISLKFSEDASYEDVAGYLRAAGLDPRRAVVEEDPPPASCGC